MLWVRADSVEEENAGGQLFSVAQYQGTLENSLTWETLNEREVIVETYAWNQRSGVERHQDTRGLLSPVHMVFFQDVSASDVHLLPSPFPTLASCLGVNASVGYRAVLGINIRKSSCGG